MLDPDEAVQQLRGSSSMGVRVPSRVLNVAKNVAMLSNQDGVKHIPNSGQVISPYVSYFDMLGPHSLFLNMSIELLFVQIGKCGSMFNLFVNLSMLIAGDCGWSLQSCRY